MGKTVKFVLVAVVAIALVVVAQPALAALIAGKAAAIAGTIGIGAKLAAAVIVAAASTLATRLIMGAPKDLSNSIFERLNISVEPTTPRRIVFGTTAAGADERFHEKVKRDGLYNGGGGFGTARPKKGDYFFRVLALASHRVHAVRSVYLEDTLSFNGSYATGKFATKDGLSIKAVTEGSSANAFTLGSGRFWNTSCRFTGCAYLAMRQRLDADIYPDGMPSRITTVVDGCPVYDPRLDSTRGGSGTHRPDNQSTWQFYSGTNQIGRNPALCLLVYLIGYRINGKLVWGMGIPADRIDLANFIAYANVCDEPVTTKAGGSIKRYQCDGTWSTNDSHETIINSIVATMGAAKLVDSGGLYELVGGYDDLDEPIITFTERDLIGQYEWKPSLAVRERFNIVRGRFTNPDKLYQIEDYGEITVDPLHDGIPRTQVLELGAVTRAETCQRIAKQFLLRNAYSGIFSATFMPSAFAVQVGSLVRMVIPSEGWAQPGKLFRVVDQSESADLLFSMTLQEEAPEIYAFDASEAIDLPADIRPPGYDPNEAVTVDNLAASSVSVPNSTGGSVSQITVTWDEPDAAVSSIAIETSVDGLVWNEVSARFAPDALQFVFNSPVSGISTQVRSRFRMFSGAYGPYATTSVVAAVGTGANAINGYLTDESVTFAADKDGNIL